LLYKVPIKSKDESESLNPDVFYFSVRKLKTADPNVFAFQYLTFLLQEMSLEVSESYFLII